MAREREARPDRQARHGEAGGDDERDDAHGPAEADDGDEALEDDRKEHAAACAPTSREPDRERASPTEPVSKDGN